MLSATTLNTNGIPDKTWQPNSVILETSYGEITVALYWKYAPNTCRNFAELVRRGYYNNTIFHRIISNVMIQGGDPSGTGYGGGSIYGRLFSDEIHSDLKHTCAGILSMTNSGPDKNGSRFFITLGPMQQLDGKHTIFGRVLSGMEIVKRISLVETERNGRPIRSIKILKGKVPEQSQNIPPNIFKCRIILNRNFVANYLKLQTENLNTNFKRAYTEAAISTPVLQTGRGSKRTATQKISDVDATATIKPVATGAEPKRACTKAASSASLVQTVRRSKRIATKMISDVSTTATNIPIATGAKPKRACTEAAISAPVVPIGKGSKRTATQMISDTSNTPIIQPIATGGKPKRACKSTNNEAVNSISLVQTVKGSKRTAKQRALPKLNALMPSFHIFELVWGHVKGFPSWPAVIESQTPKGKFLLHFFGDYTRAELGRNAITHFFEGFNQFQRYFGNVKLQKAIGEAKIFLLDTTQNRNECYVCKMLALKNQMYAHK